MILYLKHCWSLLDFVEKQQIMLDSVLQDFDAYLILFQCFQIRYQMLYLAQHGGNFVFKKQSVFAYLQGANTISGKI